MYSVKQVENGLLKYVDKELLPNLVELGDAMLNNLCHNRMAQMLGVVTPEGRINVDVVRSLALTFVGENGLKFHVMGVDVAFTKDDIDKVYQMIKEG